MKKWEYRWIRFDFDEDVVLEEDGRVVGNIGNYPLYSKGGKPSGPSFFETMQKLGLEGWEAVNFRNDVLLLKRQVE